MSPSPRSPDPATPEDPPDAAVFWTFALAAWDRPALRETLLRWQEEHDVGVIFLLFVCWFPETLTARRWNQLQRASRQWNLSVTRRIRQLRRRVRKIGWPRGYEGILALELSSERLEAIWLTNVVSTSGRPMPAPDVAVRVAHLLPELPPAERIAFLAQIRALL